MEIERANFDDLYKGNQEGTRLFQFQEDLNEEKNNYSFDPVRQIIPINVNQKTVKADLLALFNQFQESFSSKLIDGIESSLIELNNNLQCLQPDEESFLFIINSDFIDQIIFLLLNPPTYEIYQPVIYLIINLFKISIKYDKPEIFERINSIENFDLLQYLLMKINPNYKENPNQEISQILLQIDMILLPHFLHLISFYYIKMNDEIRDLIFQVVISPNINFLFQFLDDQELTVNVSRLVFLSTKYPIKNIQFEYIISIINFFIDNIESLDMKSQRFFFKAINNLADDENVMKQLFESNFDGLIECYISIKKNELIEDKSLKYALTLKSKMLCANCESVTVSYQKLIDIINSKFNRSKKVAFDFLKKAIELRSNDKPFNDDQLFNYFINSMKNGKFEMKYKFIRVIEIWMVKSNGFDILNRSQTVLEEISPFLQQISTEDQLFVIVLEEVKRFLDVASGNADALQNLKNIVEINVGVDYLVEIQSESQSSEAVCSLVQSILNYWSNEE